MNERKVLVVDDDPGMREVLESILVPEDVLVYSAVDGRIIWEFNTAQAFSTVNGVKARGGSISDGGVAVVDGMVFANSGYSHHSGIIPGNAFLAFGLE